MLDARAILDDLLRGGILPFWLPATLDRRHGGYALNHGPDGRWRGPARKRLVTQARTLWFFARLARSPLSKPAHVEAAEHGWRFLRDRLLDRRYGGYLWEVEADGRPRQDGKHLYGQTFAIYALAEYARAAKDREALALARETFRLLERHAHDARHGGYRECFRRDWTPLRDGRRGLLGQPAGLKLQNTHLHVLEALTALLDVDGGRDVRERLEEVRDLLLGPFARPGGLGLREALEHNLSPARADTGRVSYGHDLETVFLLIEAARALGCAPPVAVRGLFEHALLHGFDRARGGFFAGGPAGGTADDRRKVWWVQAEALVSALTMHQLTGEAAFLGCFARTLAWIATRQAVPGGDWHAEVLEDGTIRGDRAGAWKDPYHQGRAVLRCLEVLPVASPGAGHS